MFSGQMICTDVDVAAVCRTVVHVLQYLHESICQQLHQSYYFYFKRIFIGIIISSSSIVLPLLSRTLRVKSKLTLCHFLSVLCDLRAILLVTYAQFFFFFFFFYILPWYVIPKSLSLSLIDVVQPHDIMVIGVVVV